MTWIFKKTPDGRGGWIHSEAFDQESGKQWMHAIGLDSASGPAAAFKGAKVPLNMNLVPRAQIVIKKRSGFPDMWWGENGLMTISVALKDLIEAHDPGAALHLANDAFDQASRGI